MLLAPQIATVFRHVIPNIFFLSAPTHFSNEYNKKGTKMIKRLSYSIFLTLNDAWPKSGIFEIKPQNRMWLCLGISLVQQALQTWSKAQKTWQVF